MPSRLKRFGDLKTITKQSSEIIDKKANIVMLDGRVFLGKVVDITTDKLVYINNSHKHPYIYIYKYAKITS